MGTPESTMFHASRDLAIDQIHTALDRLEATRTWTSAPPAQTVASLVGTAPIVCALNMITVDGLNKAQQFQGRPTDVFLSTFPKTGTTWLQQICHQLRTGGHTDFEEISEESICPWLEVAGSLCIDLDAEHIANPRVFKTHQPISQMSHMASKFLCVIRDPEATLLSNFKFAISKGDKQVKDINEFVKMLRWVPGGAGERGTSFGAYIWQFYREFWQCRELSNVHVVTYEGMRKDLKALLPGIASFLEVTLTDELSATVMELSSFKWMKDNEHQFDDHYMGYRQKQLADEHAAAGREVVYANEVPKYKQGSGSDRNMTTSSKVGLQVADEFNTTITDDTRLLLAELWLQEVTPFTGHTTYAKMASDVASA